MHVSTIGLKLSWASIKKKKIYDDDIVYFHAYTSLIHSLYAWTVSKYFAHGVKVGCLYRDSWFLKTNLRKIREKKKASLCSRVDVLLLSRSHHKNKHNTCHGFQVLLLWPQLMVLVQVKHPRHTLALSMSRSTCRQLTFCPPFSPSHPTSLQKIPGLISSYIIVDWRGLHQSSQTLLCRSTVLHRLTWPLHSKKFYLPIHTALNNLHVCLLPSDYQCISSAAFLMAYPF